MGARLRAPVAPSRRVARLAAHSLAFVAGLPFVELLAVGCVGRLPALRVEAVDRAALLAYLRPSIVWIEGGGGTGTGFGCFARGLACTAKHVVGVEKSVTVRSFDGAEAKAAVVNLHPADDVALLDVRGLPSVRPLPISPIDGPSDGTIVCRVGPPAEPKGGAFVRCDPTVGMLMEYAPGKEGVTIGRLLHLGAGQKGDSGSPIVDPQTGLVVGAHVSEENGVSRGATAMALADAFEPLRKQAPWSSACPAAKGSDARALALSLACGGGSEVVRAERFRALGVAFLRLGRKVEAHSAFSESLTYAAFDARSWLLRALVHPGSAASRDDAAFAWRLSPALRGDRALADALPSVPRQLRSYALGLRDELAPRGKHLATIVGPKGCASCPETCATLRARADVVLYEVEGANHPAAEEWLRARVTGEPLPKRGRTMGATYSAIGERAANGCGATRE